MQHLVREHRCDGRGLAVDKHAVAHQSDAVAVVGIEVDVPGAYLDGSHALHLDLGEVAEIAEVSVNGTSIGILWNVPYRTDVTRLLKAGANRLEVNVTNLWHNRIVGDLRSPEAGVHTRTNLKHMFRADMELLRSGLLGPVVLRSTVDFDVPIR